jgi:hypothetical protein
MEVAMSRYLFILVLAVLLTACTNPNSAVAASPNVAVPVEQPTDSFTVILDPTATNPSAVSGDLVAPAATESPMSDTEFAPRTADKTLTRGTLMLQTKEILTLESFPPQFSLHLTGSLPTPCNQLRVAVNPPDAENRINIEVYSVLDPSMMCAQVLKEFEANVLLGNFPAGHYSVWINGENIGEFDA